MEDFHRKVLEWYEKNGRSFPWRDKERNNYEICIAEVLLQKTKAESVEKVYENFLKDFPTFKSLANTKPEDVKSHLSNLGLQERRTEWLKKIADKITKRGGQIPNNEKELKSLPGIGLYIGNAILCFGFNQRKPILDANTSRVVGRVHSVSYEGDLRRNHELKEKAEAMLPDDEIKKFNWALLDIGALLCGRDFPRCSECPLNKVCDFYEGRNVLVVPVQNYALSKVIEENIYAFPSSSRKKRVPEYVAFYQTKPVSSVTHLGKVGDVREGIEKGEKLSMKYRIMAFGDKVNEEATVVNIEKLKELESPIPYDGRTGMQGPNYTSLKNIDEAKNIKGL